MPFMKLRIPSLRALHLSVVLLSIVASAAYLALLGTLAWATFSTDQFLSNAVGGTHSPSLILSFVFGFLLCLALVVSWQYLYPALRHVVLSSIRSEASTFASLLLFSEQNGSKADRIQLFERFSLQLADQHIIPVRLEYFVASTNTIDPGAQCEVLLGLTGRSKGDFGPLEYGVRFNVLRNGHKVGIGMALSRNKGGI